MYFSFSFSLLSFALSQPCLVSNPIPNDSTINLSINKSKKKKKKKKKKDNKTEHIARDPPVLSLL